MTKFAVSSVSCGFGHIYWRSLWWRISFFVQWMLNSWVYHGIMRFMIKLLREYLTPLRHYYLICKNFHARYLHVMDKFYISLIWNMFANLYSYLLIFLTSFFLIDSHCWWIWTTLQTSLSDEEGCRFLRVTAFPIQWEDQVRLFAKQIVEVGKISSKRLAHLKPMFHPYRIQPIDFQCKYIDWFLYKWSIGLIWVKSTFLC